MKRNWKLIVLAVVVLVALVGVLFGVYLGNGSGTNNHPTPLVTTSH